MNQTFFVSPKFNKKPIYNSPTNKYQEFSNAYVYSIIVKTGNGTPNRADVCDEATKEWNKIKNKSKAEIEDIIRNYLVILYNLSDIQIMRLRSSMSRETLTSSLSTLPMIRSIDPVSEISINASAQRRIASEIITAEKNLAEFEQIYNITTDSQFRHDTYIKIESLRAEIKSNKERIIKLKRNAEYTRKCKENE